MNLYFFAPWIVLFFMIAVVVTTLIIVQCLISLCVYEAKASHRHNHGSVVDSPKKGVAGKLGGSWRPWTRAKVQSQPETCPGTRTDSFCDISVTSASYHPYPWLEEERFQQRVESNLQNCSYRSYDSITTTTTDTDFYRDWRHSIEFNDFSDFMDPKYKDRNQNVIYI